MILMRNQAAGNFGIGFGRKNRLAALFRITAPDTADVEGWTATIAFQRRITFFTEQFIHSDSGLVFGFVKRDLCNHFAFGRGNFLHVIIETGDRDPSVGISYVSHQFAQHINRISDCTPEMPGMQIAVGTSHFHFPIGQSTKTGG